MKIESLQVSPEPNQYGGTHVTYRKLGEDAYLIDEQVLVLFIEGALGKEYSTYHVTQNPNYSPEFLEMIKQAVIKLHDGK